MAAKRTRAERGTGRKRPDPIQRQRAFDVLSRMRRDKMSLSRAARLARTTPETVRKQVGSVLSKGTIGRWIAKPSDQFVRPMLLLTPKGNVSNMRWLIEPPLWGFVRQS